jgi:peptidoglycan/xylan/chitin deacetylase (PgdA/CDA1 family)
VAILTFHHIDERFLPGINNYKPGRLRSLLVFLKQEGFDFVSLHEHYLRSADKRAVALTFDDGYASFYSSAFPILCELEIPATVFIPYGYVGRKAAWDYLCLIRRINHLSAEQIREISRFRVEIGSHGFRHISLAGLSGRLIKLELERSKKGLEELTGKPVRYLSYPFGKFSRAVEESAMGQGYEKGYSLSFFKRSFCGFSMPRFGVYSIDNHLSVLKKTGTGLAAEVEKLKGAVINAYSDGTVILNRLRSYNRSVPINNC